MTNAKNIQFLGIFLLATTLLSGCVKNTKMTGYNFEDKKLENFQTGKTRKAIVKRELGSPSVVSNYGNET